jgi:hypothetical protein
MSKELEAIVAGLIQRAADSVSYSHNFANAKPDIGKTEREHILGLCQLVEDLVLVLPASGCGACGDGCLERGSCRVSEESPSLSTQAGEGWRDIATAPESGTFLVYMPEDERLPMQVARWHPNIKVIGAMFAFDAKTPTHWRPLPSPPSDTKGEG